MSDLGEDGRGSAIAQVCELGIEGVEICLDGRSLLNVGCEQGRGKFSHSQGRVDLLPGAIRDYPVRFHEELNEANGIIPFASTKNLTRRTGLCDPGRRNVNDEAPMSSRRNPYA